MKIIGIGALSVSTLQIVPDFITSEGFLKFLLQTVITGFTLYFQWKVSKNKSQDGTNK
jgi:hypothetical protein